MCQAVRDMDRSLSGEDIAALRPFLPSEDEMAAIRSYDGPGPHLSLKFLLCRFPPRLLVITSVCRRPESARCGRTVLHAAAGNDETE